MSRTRPDMCPGIERPWIADDGALLRVRLPGGALQLGQLRGLLEVAETWGDGAVHLTSRANLQLRALPTGDALAAPRRRIAELGLLPHPTHDLVRNVMCSPLTGLGGAPAGRADLRGVVAELDRLICADADLAGPTGLSGKFLWVLDDGSGDLIGRDLDLGAVALDADVAQLRVGRDWWGPVVPLADLPQRLVAWAGEFLRAAQDAAGGGDSGGDSGGGSGCAGEAAWHVDELGWRPADCPAAPPDPRTPSPSAPLAPGPVPGTDRTVHPVSEGVLTRATLPAPLRDAAPEAPLVLTPWRSLVG